MKKILAENKVVTLKVYEECKYTTNSLNEVAEIKYNDVVAFDVVNGEQAQEIEAETDGTSIDDYHEYLVLYFENGNTGTFRNSYCDMFLR